VRQLFAPPARAAVRALEATPEQVVATGAMAGTYGRDPVDGDTGYRIAGTQGRREVPYWTQEKARTYSVTAYRSNPMATAIIDTYTAFAIGDNGVKLQVTNPEVARVAEEFWNDPGNALGDIQEVSLRSTMLLGEKLYELLIGQTSGVVRFSPIDPINIADIALRDGNPMWPAKVLLRPADMTTDYRSLTIAQVDDATGLRDGRAVFWAPWKTLDTDVRGMPFLTPILDDLDSYATVLSNLIDRTALARYIAFDVTVTGSQDDVNKFVEARRGTHVPPSGSIEVHNQSVEWKPMQLQTGAYEDSKASQTILTSVAAGAGLAKTWLAEPEGANRATSHTMAEPVRRRVGGVQNVWLKKQTELVRFAVDRAVAAKRLQPTVKATDPRTGQTYDIRASEAVTVTGPEIAAADAQLQAQILLNLSTALEQMVLAKVLTPEAAAVAARKGWEDYMGVPYQSELGSPKAKPDDIATHIDDTGSKATKPRLVSA
jgi:hypothetical protein